MGALEQNDWSKFDLQCMQAALEQAELARQSGEVPIGAVIALSGQMIAVGYNRSVQWHDATAHAEIVALRAAGQAMSNYRLPGATLYVTLEPCPMCLSAMVHARIDKVMFGATDPKTGALGGASDLSRLPQLLRRITFRGGLLESECTAKLIDFFKERRASQEKNRKKLRLE